MTATTLLQPGDPAAFVTEIETGTSPILFASDHAGRAIPRALGTLGLDEEALGRHIAWDIGIQGVTSALAARLDATYVYQPYSRLVIDCNRRPGTPQSVMTLSDGVAVPGNAGLTSEAIALRVAEILRPYHSELERVIAARREAGQPTVLFAMHSCTPLFGGEDGPRPWPIMVMADRDWRVGDALVALLREETDLNVGVNVPYTVNAESDYTIPLHAEAGGLPYVEIELRQDLIAGPEGQAEWAERLADLFPRAVERSGVLDA